MVRLTLLCALVVATLLHGTVAADLAASMPFFTEVAQRDFGGNCFGGCGGGTACSPVDMTHWECIPIHGGAFESAAVHHADHLEAHGASADGTGAGSGECGGACKVHEFCHPSGFGGDKRGPFCVPRRDAPRPAKQKPVCDPPCGASGICYGRLVDPTKGDCTYPWGRPEGTAHKADTVTTSHEASAVDKAALKCDPPCEAFGICYPPKEAGGANVCHYPWGHQNPQPSESGSANGEVKM